MRGGFCDVVPEVPWGAEPLSAVDKAGALSTDDFEADDEDDFDAVDEDEDDTPDTDASAFA